MPLKSSAAACSALLATPSLTTPASSWRRVLASLCLALAGLGSAPTTSAAEPPLRIYAAGSLKAALSAVVEEFARLSPGAPITVEWGPAGVLRERLEQGEAFDIFASAALGHAEALARSGRSGPAVIFARNSLCAVTTPEFPLSTANFEDTLLAPATRIGTSTPKADPSGDYTWEMFRRIDTHRPGAFATLSGKALQLYGSGKAGNPPAGVPAGPLTDFLDGKVADLLLVYCTSAHSLTAKPGKSGQTYRAVTLPEAIQVGAEYGVTVARGAPARAHDLTLYLLSPAGQKRLAAHGFTPVAASLEGEAR